MRGSLRSHAVAAGKRRCAWARLDDVSNAHECRTSNGRHYRSKRTARRSTVSRRTFRGHRVRSPKPRLTVLANRDRFNRDRNSPPPDGYACDLLRGTWFCFDFIFITKLRFEYEKIQNTYMCRR